SRAATLRLWEVPFADDRKLHGHGGEVTSVAFSPDGARLVSGSLDRTLRVWRPASFPADSPVGSPLPAADRAAFAKGRWQAQVTQGGHIEVFDASGGPPARLPARTATLLAIAAAPDGALLADYADGVRRRFPPLGAALEALTNATVDGFSASRPED